MSNLYAIKKAAAELGGISQWTLRKHIAQGAIKVTRIGRRVFLASEEIERIRQDGLPSLRARANGTSRFKSAEGTHVNDTKHFA